MKKLLIALLFLPLICSAQNRLKDKPEAVTPASDDWLYLDGSRGVRKLSPSFLQPAPTVAALASDALTLSQDNVIRTASITGTKNFTLASAGSSGSWLTISAPITGTQTVTTNFAVHRGFASAAANISLSYTDHLYVTLLNIGGEIYWLDEYRASDIPAGALANGMTATTQSQADNSTKLATTAYVDTAVAAVGSGTGLSAYSHFVWPTALLGSKPANTIVADATGATNSGTLDLMTSNAVTGGTWLMQGLGTVTTPTSSLAAGSYVGTQNITITEQSGADTRVTQNGVDPVRSDTLVSGTVAVTTSGTVKLRSFLNGYAPSAVSSYAYTITAPASWYYANHLVYTNLTAAESANPTWTHTASPVFGYVTAPAPITGSASSLKTYWGDKVRVPFTAIAGTAYFCVKVNPVSVGTGAEGFVIRNGATKLVMISFGTSSTLTLQGGASGPTATTTYTVGDEIFLKVVYTPGTGFNSVIDVYTAPVSTGIFGAAKIHMTTGKGQLNADSVEVGPSNNQTLIWNDLIVNNAAIGDNPVIP